MPGRLRHGGAEIVFLEHGRDAHLSVPCHAQASDGALTVEKIAGHPALYGCLQEQARLMLQAYEGNPRLSSVFATQQRWLMGQSALALYFRARLAGRGATFSAARFFEFVAEHKVASRNTADAFVKEMLHYNYVRHVDGAADRRTRPLEPTQTSIEAIHGWLAIHLSTLDKLDGGDRLQSFLAQPEAIAELQPRIADGLLCSPQVRQPERTFSLFTWLDNGGVVMEWLIAGIGEAKADTERLPTGIASIAEMADWLKLSRTHLARKLREAEELGSIGWLGKRGHSTMWVSQTFRREFAEAQAVKLAIIDAAFGESFRRGARAPRPVPVEKHPEIVRAQGALQIDPGVSLS